MRQSANDQRGNVGETAAVLFFEELGWGPLPTNKHDLGTDLFVQLRSDDLTDLGTLLGVQVKTGDSFFDDPARIGKRTGWWFREDDHRHEGYWSNHHIPHILLMQDEARERRYWVRLDRNTIESTGKGIRVFVPDDQPLMKEAATAWTEMAAEARKLQSFEGARWTFNITQLPEAEWPRYALLASRITAPHPNQGVGRDINWAEAVALCIQADLQRWDHFAKEREAVPTPAESLASDDPGWRFAGAIYQWLQGNTDALEALDVGKMTPALQIAHAICVGAVRAGRGEWAEAIALLQARRDSTDQSVDQAWLTVHLGWALFESGQISEARTSFEDSVTMHAAFPSSLTNSAIRSAGILALFDLAPMFSGDLAAAVQASDSTLSWWQNQQIENALNRFLRRSYARWVHDNSVTIGGGDTTHNNLLSAELSARLAGNRRSARYATYLRAMANLVLPNGSHAKGESQLESLRTAGYPKELALALRHFRNEGPLSQVGAYMADVTIERATTTSIWADLESLKTAGAYLPDEAALRWLSYLLDAFDEPKIFKQRFNIESNPQHEILGAIAGLRLHFGEEHEHRIVKLALSLPDDPTQLLERPLLQLFKSLNADVLSEHTPALAARGRGLPTNSWLRRMLIDMTATRSGEARDAVSARIMTGSLGAIPDGLAIDSLTVAESRVVVNACVQQFQEYDKQDTGIAVGAPDPYHIAALVALFGPDPVRAEAWRAVVEAVSAESVIHDRKTAAIRLMASRSTDIPQEHREALLHASERFRAIPSSHFSEFFAPPGSAFSELYLELHAEDDAWQATLTGLLTGTPDERRTGINVLARRSGHELLLLTLTRDADSDVARSAMHGLALRAAADSAVAQMVVPRLLSLIASSGEQAALHIGGGIVTADDRVPEISPLVTALQSHESLQIRSLAHELDESSNAAVGSNT